MRVYKFGGASVKDAEAVKNVANIIKQNNPDELLVVVSAMGKSTNALESILADYLLNGKNFQDEIKQLKKFHFDITKELFNDKNHDIFNQLEDLFIQLEWFFELGEKDNYDFLYDQVVCFGEILSTKIVAAYLQEQSISAKWLDSRNFIITNDNYREAKVDFKVTESLINRKLPQILKNNVIVTQGFIGKNRAGHTTTLGREGSDFTAAIFAFSLNAEEVCIWKDVPGILNADPKWFSKTVKFDELSYSDSIEMAYYGASVLHPKTMQPLQNKAIPLKVKSFINPNAEGTVISADAKDRFDIPAFIVKDKQLLVSIAAKNYSFIAEQNLSKIFKVLADNRVKINLMQNTAISFSFCTDADERKINNMKADLEEEYNITFKDNLQLFTIRNYTQEAVDEYIDADKVKLEQKTGRNLQFVLAY